MVIPGVVQVGKWKSEESMFRSGNLEVVHSPAENVIASKLVRAEPYDLDDIVYLMSRLDVSVEQVRIAVSTTAGSARDRAKENMFFEIRSDLLCAVNDAGCDYRPRRQRHSRP